MEDQISDLNQILTIFENWKEVKSKIEEEEKCLWSEIQEGINFFGKLSKSGKHRKNIKIPDFSFMPKHNVKDVKADNSTLAIQSPKPTKLKRKAAEMASLGIQELARKNLIEKLRQPSINTADTNATIVIKKLCTEEPVNKLNLEPFVLLERNQTISSNKKEEDSEEEEKDDNNKEQRVSRSSHRIKSMKRTSSQRLTETKETPNKKRKDSSSLEQLNDENEDPKKVEEPEQEVIKPSSSLRDIRRSQRILANKNEQRTSLDSSISPPKLKVKNNNHSRTSNRKVPYTGSKKLTPAKPKVLLSATKANSALKKIQLLQAEQRKKEEEALRKKLKEEEALKKKEELIKTKQEHLRRKNEGKALKVTATREAIEKEKRVELEKMEKEKEERERHLREEIEKAKEAKLLKKKQMNMQKAQEVEERRLKEEAARLAKLKEQEEEQRRQEELRIKQQEHAERLQQQRKMEEELRQKELTSKVKEPKMDVVDVDDYGIDNDIKMDEEEETTKPIPEWAKRENRLKELKYQQAITQEELTKFFAMPDKILNLQEFFGKHAIKRVRTSSAVWSPK